MASSKSGGGFRFTIDGLGPLNAALNALPAKVANKVIRQALRESLRPVADAVRAEAPVETGLTRASVKIRAMKAKKGRIGVVVQIGEGSYKGETFYAAFEDLGHEVVSHGRKSGHYEGSHFMEAAFARVGPAAKEDAVRRIKDGIEREASRG